MSLSSTNEQQGLTPNTISSQLGHILEEYSEIATILPVVIGLLTTTQLRLRGATALVVNIGIAAMTRQAIVQLKKQAAGTVSATNITTVNSVADVGASSSLVQTKPEDYTIIHSVAGRIRLYIPRLSIEPSFGKRLEKLLLNEDIVLGVRINTVASSIAIRYDNVSVTELDLGLRLLEILEQAEQPLEIV